MSIINLTIAEFKKIFKRPSIFIMALILVATIFASIFVFSPSNRSDDSITYANAQTSYQYYSNFYNDEVINSKKSFDDNFAITDNTIAYYQAINTNSNILENCYNNCIECIEELLNTNDINIKDKIRKDLTINLKDFVDAYKSLDALSQFEDIRQHSTTPQEYVSYQPRNYYLSNGCAGLMSLYTQCNDLSNSASEVANICTTNDYATKLKDALNNGKHFIYTTLKGFASDYIEFYKNFVNTTVGRDNLSEIQIAQNNLIKSLEVFNNYLTTLVEQDFPTIIISKTNFYDLSQRIFDSQEVLKAINENNLDQYREARILLDNINLEGLLNNITKVAQPNSDSYIVPIQLSSSAVNKMLEIQFDTNSNKQTILEKIENYKNDEGIKNIGYEITNYSLLQSAYVTAITDITLLDVVDGYDTSQYTNFYGDNYLEFNKYQYTERLTLNSYYIENNTYSNNYLNNFSFNNNSGTKTNVYDFVYFTMEICALVITVFAVMLICNLITGETESGTIKLLLVRPYKRSKIITSKLLATISFVVTFMLFSSILSFVGGVAMFGMPTSNIISVINGTTAFEISPLLLIIIDIFTLFIDILFFVLLSLMVAIICKNYAASISCVIVLLIVNYALNIIFTNSFWYTLLPGMNLHWFKYLGNTFISTSGVGISDLLQKVLITGIHSSMALPYSLLLYTVYSVVFLAVSYTVFQKRDF